MLRTPVLIAVVVVLGVGLTGCATGEDALAVRAKAQASARTAALATMPARYRDGGSGLGWAWDDGTCRVAAGACRTLDVYAYQACESGYVEGDLLTASKAVAGVVNGTISPMRAGTTRTVRLEWDEAAVASVRVTHVDCS